MRNSILFLAILFILNLPVSAHPSEEEVWHDLGKGWKVKILSIETFQSLKRSIFTGGGRVEADGRFIAITIYADASREAYLKKVFLILGISREGDQLTFVLNEKGEKFPLKGFLRAGDYHPEFVGQGFRGPFNEFTMVFDVPVDSISLKLLITKGAPLIDLLSPK